MRSTPSPWSVAFSSLLIVAIVFSPFSVPVPRYDPPSPAVAYRSNAKQSYLAAQQQRKKQHAANPSLRTQSKGAIATVLSAIMPEAPSWIGEKKADMPDTVASDPDMQELQEEPGERIEGETIQIASADTGVIIPDSFIAMGAVSNPESGTLTLEATASEIVEVRLNEEAQVTEQTDVHGGTTQAEYNDAGDPVKIVDPNGTTTYYSYDAHGNLVNTYTEQSDGGQPLSMLENLQ